MQDQEIETWWAALDADSKEPVFLSPHQDVVRDFVDEHWKRNAASERPVIVEIAKPRIVRVIRNTCATCKGSGIVRTLEKPEEEPNLMARLFAGANVTPKAPKTWHQGDYVTVGGAVGIVLAPNDGTLRVDFVGQPATVELTEELSGRLTATTETEYVRARTILEKNGRTP